MNEKMVKLPITRIKSLLVNKFNLLGPDFLSFNADPIDVKNIMLRTFLFSVYFCFGENAMADISPLLKRLPSLKRIPHVRILEEATQVHSLDKLNAHYQSNGIPANLWVKRDDQSHLALGGNKSRKLEFIIGDAKNKGASKLITSGNWGSNHAYSTAQAAKRFNMQAELLLGNQPVTENVKKKLLSDFALGAKMQYYGNQIALGIGIAKSWLKGFFKKNTYYIPPGGSSPLGNLGYVNAFLELLDQLGRENMPKRIILPMGTAGTTAGLLMGRCIAGLESEVEIIGVGIADGPLSNRKLLVRTTRKLEKFIRKSLSKKDLEKLGDCNFKHNNPLVSYKGNYSEPGYGEANEVVHELISQVKKIEGVVLDPTYSGKAFHYLHDTISADKVAVKTLFWMTYNSFDLSEVIKTYPWKNANKKYLDLPKKFHSIFVKD